ncbi:M56 family metallopeptidase [Acetivibrio clariflavus]|uniref:M56 family metallopeptidase n=1 Tax=Acetivibrio clariflavus TaxID=288965 RepID=UPI0009E00CB4|nr:M56 family metallopeptidase [Acetivibrio clariflavus]
MKHELIHYKHHDILYKAVFFLARSVHWFNPFVRLMNFYANIALESYCDDCVVKNKDISFRENYGKVILASIKGGKRAGTAFSTYFSSNFKTVKTRIANIFDMRSRRNGVPAAVIMLALVVISSSLVACKPEQFDLSSLNPTNTKNSVNQENTASSDYTDETEAVPNLENRSEFSFNILHILNFL